MTGRSCPCGNILREPGRRKCRICRSLSRLPALRAHYEVERARRKSRLVAFRRLGPTITAQWAGGRQDHWERCGRRWVQTDVPVQDPPPACLVTLTRVRAVLGGWPVARGRHG